MMKHDESLVTIKDPSCECAMVDDGKPSAQGGSIGVEGDLRVLCAGDRDADRHNEEE